MQIPQKLRNQVLTFGHMPIYVDAMEQKILEQIEEQAAKRAITPKTLCRLAVNNGKLYTRLQDGGSITLATAAKLTAYFTTPIYVRVRQ